MAQNPNPSLLDPGQIIKRAFNEADDAIRVEGSISVAELAVDDIGQPAGTEVKLAGGVDGNGDAQALAVDVDGQLQVDVLSSALPSGAATSAAQTDGSQKTQIVDATGEIVEVKALNVALAGTDKGLITHSVIQGQTTGGGGGYVDVKVAPSGALVTESTIAALDAAVLGQETMANSLPVVIASNQSAVPVSAASLPLPTGAATEAKQDDAIASLASIDSKLTSPLAVTGPLTDAELRASAVPVSAASLPLPTGAATEATLLALSEKSAGALVPEKYDELEITYVGSTTDIDTVTYKLASTTVATLTLSYDLDNRLVGVVKT